MDYVDDYKGLDLTETGTRYDHYMELKEVFMTGMTVIDGMNPSFLAPADKTMRVKLQYAVEMIDRRICKLSNYEGRMQPFMTLPKVLDVAAKDGIKAAREQKLLGGMVDDKHEKVNQADAQQNSQEPPDEPTGV